MKIRQTVAHAVIACAAAVLLSVPAWAQVQTSGQQGCINAMNKSGQKVAATQGKNDSSCIKDAGLEKLTGMNAEQCLTADRKGKVAGATTKTTAGQTAKCGELPSFGFTGAAVVNEAAVEREISLVHDVFDSPLTSAILTDTPGAKCQAGVAKAYEKYAATFVKEYNSCKKSGLKAETITTSAGLEACIGADPKTKISGAAGKLGDTITKSCEGVTLATAFPGECTGQAGSAATLSACIANAADCRMCEAVNLMDAIERGCDTFDDGALNGSCSECGNGFVDDGEQCDDGVSNSDVAPDACRTSCVNAFCGDGVLDFPEECDDGGNAGGDGCDASCACEAGNPAATCQEPLCPTGGELVLYAGTTGLVCTTNVDCVVGTCDAGLGRCVTETELDTGWYGLAHNSDINDQVRARGDLICAGPLVVGPEPCGLCKVVGIDPSTGQCRCANDSRTQCDEPFDADVDDCGGNTCNCYFGPPLPLSSGNVPACVVNRFAEDVTGTANVDNGKGKINARLASVVYLGENVLTPCPTCGGTCTAPVANVGDPCAVNSSCDTSLGSADGVCGNYDPTVGDGLRGGICYLGVNNGLTCDIDASNESFPAPGGGGSSLDCFPDLGKNVSGTGLKIVLESTTGTSALPAAAIPCGFDSSPVLCACGVCSGDTGVTCTSNGDCTGIGTCGKVGNGNPKDNSCSDGVCSDLGGGEGGCLANTPDNYCDGITRADGLGFIQCGSNGDCSALGPAAGACTLTGTRACFLDPITVTGVEDPSFPVAVAAFCIPPTANSGINTVAGLPGPGRVKNVAEAESYCASNPAVIYTPGVGGCP